MSSRYRLDNNFLIDATGGLPASETAFSLWAVYHAASFPAAGRHWRVSRQWHTITYSEQSTISPLSNHGLDFGQVLTESIRMYSRSWQIVLLVGLQALLLLGAPVVSQAENKESRAMLAAEVVASKGPLVIAHRGDSATHPENTLPAFASAVRAGADLVELDYYHSSDGVLTVFHDKTLKRTTNAVALFGRDAPFVSFPLAELKRLDAGSWKDKRFRDTRIPTLSESLKVIQAGSITLIEHKHGDAAACIALLREQSLLRNVVVQSFDWQFVADCHKLAPELVLAALGGKELTSKKLDEIEQTGARIVAWRESDIGDKEIQAIHRRGWRAWVYTVNEPNRATELGRAGIDGVITDKPGLMLNRLATFRSNSVEE